MNTRRGPQGQFLFTTNPDPSLTCEKLRCAGQALRSSGTFNVTRSLISAEPGCSGEHHALLTLGTLTYPATLREYGTGAARTGHLDVNADGRTWLHLLTLYTRGGGDVNDKVLNLLRLPEHKRARYAPTLAYQPYQRRTHLAH